MLPRMLFLVAMLCASLASAAQPQQITVWKLDAGYYVVSGSQILAFPPAGPIVPPDDPVVPPGTPFAQAVTAAVNAIPATDQRHAAALKLAKVYEALAGQKLPPAKAVEAISTIINLGLGKDSKVLEGVYSVVNAAVAKCADEAAVSAVLAQAAEAVQATVPASGDEKAAAERYGIDWDKFLTFIMDLLVKLLPIILAL